MVPAGRITRGNFRLIRRLFAQVDRIPRINQLCRMTKEAVKATRAGLVISPGS